MIDLILIGSGGYILGLGMGYIIGLAGFLSNKWAKENINNEGTNDAN
jgi:hypothetical protein